MEMAQQMNVLLHIQLKISKMKKIFLTLIITIAIVATTQVAFAQTSPTAAPTSKVTPTKADSQIEKIKDLVASKVAELKLVDKRGVLGTVKSKTNTQINVTNSHGEATQIDIDELTKFNGATSKEDFGISDIEKGDVISFVGLFNKENKKLLARFVSRATNIPENIDGKITSKDVKEFTFVIADENGKTKTVNVESSTKTNAYDAGDTTKSGFSKLEEGQRVIVVGFKDPKVSNQINAERIIQFVSLPSSKAMKSNGDSQATGSAR